MKRKLLTVIIALLAIVACAFGLAACSGEGGNNQNQNKWGNEYSFASAYAQAQELGYAGTLDEFIEMISGKDGMNGTNGTNGTNGVTPHIGENGNWFIGETDTGVKAAGADGTNGVNGTDGKNGSDGKDGVTPHIGENGNWFIGETDTGVKAAGADGTNGVNGTNGKDGSDGLGIKSIGINNDNEIVITWTDETTTNIGKIPPCKHKFGEWETGIDATCFSMGFRYRVCSDCEYKDYMFLPSAHTEVIDEAVDSTCTETGLTEGKHCSVCNMVLVAQQRVDIISHDFDENGVCSECKNVLFEFVSVDEGRALGVKGTDFLNTLKDMEITIPSRYNGLPVIYIVSEAFRNCLALKSVTIPEGVTSTHTYAFYGCANLESVKLPSSLTTINGYSFSGCEKLKNVVLSDETSNISTLAFANCSSLNFEIYDNAKYLGTASNPHFALVEALSNTIDTCEIHSDTKIIVGAAFRNCFNLTDIIIPEGVVRISSNAFQLCSNLTNVSVPNSVTRIDVNAFASCPRLNYYVYENAKYLGNEQNPYLALIEIYITENTVCKIHEDTKIIVSSVYRGTNITEAIIPDGVVCVGSHLFRECTHLESVTMTDSVVAIHSNFFNGCTRLKSVRLSANIISIGDNLFRDCVSLETITYGGTMEQWNALVKGADWNSNTGNYIVICSDGNLDKNGNQITED